MNQKLAALSLIGSLLLTGLSSSAFAQPATGVTAGVPSQGPTSEVTIIGEDGALLWVDGQFVGTLPLSEKLVVSAGMHRFRLEHGSQKAETDPLAIPANRQAELNLTLSGRRIVAVLTLTPGAILVLEPAVKEPLRGQIVQAVTPAARQAGVALVTPARQAALLASKRALTRCLTQPACQEELARDAQAAYALSLQVQAQASTAYQLGAKILDVRTGEFGASAEEICSPCTTGDVLQKLSDLTTRLLRETINRPRGTLDVTSTPPGAKVTVDDRTLGVTPYQREAFTGMHAVVLELDGYAANRTSAQVEFGQTTTLQLQLPRNAAIRSQAGRPKWRLITGGILLGSGAILAGFGISALVTNGHCQDGSPSQDICTPYYNTVAVGSGLFGAGAALMIGGTVLLALPGKSP